MKKVFIIAEAGVNHNGSLDTAKKLIAAAAEAGADAVKFQTFKAERLVSRFAPKADYQKETTDADESQLAMLKALELTREQHLELIDCCKRHGILFLSTAFEQESLALLESLDIPLHKIPSGEITNLPFLLAVAATKKPVILSTGMSTLDEVAAAVTLLRENGVRELTVLHCTTEYPTPWGGVNLAALETLSKALGVPVGYSDHTAGIEISVAAAALGAAVIEKHFTLDKSMPGPDHKASLEPRELAKLVEAIRHVEAALGSGVKQPSASEQKNLAVVRKSIVALCGIKKGELFTAQNLTVKRPGTGVSPMLWESVLGRAAVRNFCEDELIEL